MLLKFTLVMFYIILELYFIITKLKLTIIGIKFLKIIYEIYNFIYLSFT